ncbi:Hypothetical predicted protein [Mytilus galloprovincialis]|uniref:CCHC-type domain-containing protein n=1 Tax=Mytilus galloprovincialis TaxID=29158 RepID=A0A8B6C6X8_MYTGA|nr:Hypothetical predicted protein [Mytilus galloprovincialis]
MDADTREIIQAEVQSAILGTQNKLLKSFTSLLDTWLNGFQKNIQDSQRALSESQLAKIDDTMTETFKFHKRGNEEYQKLADSSDTGWLVVDEYTTNPSTEDSEDENRIYKAQSRADSKITKEKAKRKTDPRPTPYKTKQLALDNPIPVNTNKKLFSSRRCFNCSETCHWRRECPQAMVQHTNK